MDTDFNVAPKPGFKKVFYKSWEFWRPFTGITTGATAGFLYWYFIGCTSGTCPITSNPYGSIIAGAILGFLLTPSHGRGDKKRINDQVK